MRRWEKYTFRRVAVAVSDRLSSAAAHELSVFGSIVAAVGGSASLVAVSDGTPALVDTYGDHWEVGTIASWLSTHYLICDS